MQLNAKPLLISALGTVCLLGPAAITWARPPIPSLDAQWAAAPPTIDGRLDDACWQDAKMVRSFWRVDGSARPDNLAWAKVAYDENKIYFAYSIRADANAELSRGGMIRDEGVWFSPNVQIFVQPIARAGYYVFTLNSINTQEDSKDGDSLWDCRWDSATAIGPDGWQAEIAIPYAAFDLSEGAETTWQLNLTCAHTPVNGRGHVLAWAPTFHNFHSPAYFGQVTFKRVNWRARRSGLSVDISPAQAGMLHVNCFYSQASGPKAGTLTVTMEDPRDRRFVQRQAITLTERNQTESLTFPVSDPGTYQFTVATAEEVSGMIIAERKVSVATGPILDAWLDKSLYTDEPKARLNISSWRMGVAGRRCEVSIKPVSDAIDANLTPSRSVTLDVALDRQGTASIDLEISPLAIGQHAVAVVLDPRSSSQATASCVLRKLAGRPGTISYDDRGVLRKDGDPFFPFGIYYIQNFLTDSLLEEFSESGFNTIVWEWTTAAGYINALERMHAHGIHLIPSVQNESTSRTIQDQYFASDDTKRTELAKAYYEHTTRVIDQVRQSNPPNQIAWYVQDEPNLELLPFVHHAARIVSASDQRHPTMVVLCHSTVLEAYADVADILAPDPYPGFPDGPMLKVATYIDEARRVTRGRRPVIAVLQAFGEPPGPTGTMPTPAELRCMSYLALVHGASGILYFSYSYNGPMRETHPDHWSELKDLAGEVGALAPALSHSAGRFSATLTRPGSAIHTRAIQHGGMGYLIAVNTTRRAIDNVEWQTTGFHDGVLEVLDESRELKMVDGCLGDDFAPLAVHVYRQKFR